MWGKTGARGGGGGRGRGVLTSADGGVAVFVGMQISGSRLGIDEKGGAGATEPKELEINCRRHAASHYSGATWPRSTLSPSISYYNHANCGQIRDLTYWYNIPVQPEGYESLLKANNSICNIHLFLFRVPPLITTSTTITAPTQARWSILIRSYVWLFSHFNHILSVLFCFSLSGEAAAAACRVIYSHWQCGAAWRQAQVWMM